MNSSEEEKYVSNEESDGEEHGYVALKKRQANATLYQIDPIDDEVAKKVSEYVQKGIMEKDLRYAREIFGLINTSLKKDFSYVWESPWIEEHVHDTAKRKRQENQQRSFAVKNFLKASSTHDPDNVDRFINNVDKLTKWEDKYNSKEDVKTISRVVQSFERVATRQIINFCNSISGQNYTKVNYIVKNLMKQTNGSDRGEDVSGLANSLRRSNSTFDLFANLVACEINWADSTSGNKNLSIYANKLLENKKENALLKLVHCIDNLQSEQKSIQIDYVGLPLMLVKSNICISNGILVVGKNDTKATYVLDIESASCYDENGKLNLSGIENIHIKKRMKEEPSMKKKKVEKENPKSFIDGLSTSE